jgi:hypothetical protein
MPLSAWLVIHQGDSSTTRRFSAPASPDRDTTPPPHPETPQLPRKSFPSRRLSGPPHPVMAPEELMPRTLPPHPLHRFPLPGTDFNESRIAAPSSLPHRFQQPPSTIPRGWHPPQADHNDHNSGAIRMARTRSPRPPPCVELEPPAEPPEASPPVLTPRRTQRFGIFCTAATGSGGVRRTRGMTVPRSSP